MCAGRPSSPSLCLPHLQLRLDLKLRLFLVPALHNGPFLRLFRDLFVDCAPDQTQNHIQELPRVLVHDERFVNSGQNLVPRSHGRHQRRGGLLFYLLVLEQQQDGVLEARGDHRDAAVRGRGR